MSCVDQEKIILEQECIRVGCILEETPLDRDPLDREHLDRDSQTETPWTETPWTENPCTENLPGQRPPMDRHPRTETPPGQRPSLERDPPLDRDHRSCDLWCMMGQRPPVNRMTDRQVIKFESVLLTSSAGLDHKQLRFPSQVVHLAEISHNVLSDPGSLLVPVQEVPSIVTVTYHCQGKAVTVLVGVLRHHELLDSSHLLRKK